MIADERISSHFYDIVLLDLGPGAGGGGGGGGGGHIGPAPWIG